MKLDRTDPPRLAEDADSELGRLLRLAGKRTMDASTSARLARGLEARGAFAAAAGGPSVGARGLFGRLGGAKLATIALIGFGGALFTLRSDSSELPQPAGAIESSLGAPAQPEDERIAPARSVEPPSLTVEALPSSATPAAPATSAASGPARPRGGSSSPAAAVRGGAPSATERDALTQSQAEFALIRRAQVALGSDPAGALSIVAEHARTFPRGELVQERELTAVEALARLGRKAEARARAHALVERFPRTPYVARLERALGEPLSAAKAAR